MNQPQRDRFAVWWNSDSNACKSINMKWTDEVAWFVWQAAEAQALERAAQVCESRYMGDNNREDMEARRCAEAIRALVKAKRGTTE